MDTKQKLRRDYLTIGAIDPRTGKLQNVMISYDRLHNITKRSKGQILEAAELVQLVLEKPTAVFEGLCSDDDEGKRGCGWRCYCGLPPYAYNTVGKRITPWPGEVYLVFVNRDGVAYNWRWAKCSPDDPRLPVNCNTRFKRRLI